MAIARRRYGGVYENMDFAPYVYQEFPKHVPTGAHGKYEVALNAEEERKIRDKVEFKQEIIAEKQEALGPDLEHQRLVLRCEELDIPINRKWSTTKLYGLIRAAETAVDALPAEVNDALPADEATAESIEELRTKAESLGLRVNKLWGLPRLQREIEKAEVK